MSRWHRVSVGGLVYHVLNRAANRRQIFDRPGDYKTFIELLCIAAALTGMRVLGYCVMPNHWHLIVWPVEDGALPEFLHRLTWSHALHYRRRTDSVGEGHVYQAPYRSFLVHSEEYYYNALRYVEANALRAGLVTRAEAWQWSSARIRGEECSFLAPGPLQLPADWVGLVNAPPATNDLETLRKCAQTGWPYGPEEWVSQVAITHDLEHVLKPAGRPRTPLRHWYC